MGNDYFWRPGGLRTYSRTSFPASILDFHFGYLMFMPIILSGPLFLIATGRQAEAQRVIFGVMISFVVCYAFFTLFPVSGPNWVFEHRTGPVREVLPARWVYSMLATGAVPGTAFPSSHVATTMAADRRRVAGIATFGGSSVDPLYLAGGRNRIHANALRNRHFGRFGGGNFRCPG